MLDMIRGIVRPRETCTSNLSKTSYPEKCHSVVIKNKKQTRNMTKHIRSIKSPFSTFFFLPFLEISGSQGRIHYFSHHSSSFFRFTMSGAISIQLTPFTIQPVDPETSNTQSTNQPDPGSLLVSVNHPSSPHMFSHQMLLTPSHRHPSTLRG